MYRRANFVVDACGKKTMIVLVKFKGALDLCAELFEGEGIIPNNSPLDSPEQCQIGIEGCECCRYRKTTGGTGVRSRD